jgi:hypothetical protein
VKLKKQRAIESIYSRTDQTVEFTNELEDRLFENTQRRRKNEEE